MHIREMQGAKRLILPVMSRQPRSFGSFEAIVDTGSPRTILSAKDSIKLRVPFENYPQAEALSGFGKGNVCTIKIDKFLMVLRSIDGNSRNIEMPLIVPNMPVLRKGDTNTFNHALTLPSLIGLNFLEMNKMKLVVDISKGIAYLEDSDAVGI